MTKPTVGWRSGETTFVMAGYAACLLVRSGECKSSLVVIEGNLFPVCRVVAGGAVVPHFTAMGIIRTVAGDTVMGCL